MKWPERLQEVNRSGSTGVGGPVTLIECCPSATPPTPSRVIFFLLVLIYYLFLAWKLPPEVPAAQILEPPVRIKETVLQVQPPKRKLFWGGGLGSRAIWPTSDNGFYHS